MAKRIKGQQGQGNKKKTRKVIGKKSAHQSKKVAKQKIKEKYRNG